MRRSVNMNPHGVRRQQGLTNQLCLRDARAREVSTGIDLLAAGEIKNGRRALLRDQGSKRSSFSLTRGGDALFAKSFA